eukprot:6103374-Pleurochrysis_carterae.AAC.2
MPRSTEARRPPCHLPSRLVCDVRFAFVAPSVILNIENPAETLEKHPLIKLAENPVGDSPPAGLGLKHFRFSQCFFRRDSRRKDTS